MPSALRSILVGAGSFQSPPTISSVAFSVPFITGGAALKCTINLSGPAPADYKVALSSSTPSIAVPPAVLVTPGDSSYTFYVSTVPVSGPTKVEIAARNGSSIASGTVGVEPYPVASVKFTSSSFVGAGTMQATVSLSHTAPNGGVKITLGSNSASAQVPPNTTILAGNLSQTFSVAISAVSATKVVAISASSGNPVTGTGNLTIYPTDTVSSVTLSSAQTFGGTGVSFNITLASPAPGSGIIVGLSSTSPSATMPAAITIPAGVTTKSVAVNTSAVGVVTPATLTAKVGTSSVSALLKINTSSLRLFQAGDSFAYKVTIQQTGQPTDIESGSTEVQEVSYQNQNYLAFVTGMQSNLFTQDPTSHEIQFVYSDNSGTFETDNDTVPGAVQIGDTYLLTEGGAPGDTAIWKMTVSGIGYVTTPAGTFLAYRATGVVTYCDFATNFTGWSNTQWIVPSVGFVDSTYTVITPGAGTFIWTSVLTQYSLQ